MAPMAEWTFMVYLAGDNSLSDAGDTDLAEMRAVGSTGQVHIVAEFDNAGRRGTKRYHIERDGAKEHVESLGETDSGDPKVLLDFVDWAAANYKANRYALILWNHGGGWEPAEVDRIAGKARARGYSVREASERSASPLGRVFFRTTLQKILTLPSSNERAICSDDGSGHSLDTIELGQVLKQAVKKLGQPIDLLGMDACLMSNLEVAYQARPYAHYLVASEESEPNEGWPYTAVLRKWVARPKAPTADLAKHIVDAYIKSYVDAGYSGAVTQSALDLARLDTVAGPLDGLADALIAAMPRVRDKVWQAQRKSAHFWHNTLWDVKHFCQELEKLTPRTKVRTAAKATRTALRRGSKRLVIAESHHGPSVESCGGLTVYLPMMSMSRYYADLDYAHDHRWDEMLRAYVPD
jgi:hypothetical protein